MWEDWRSEIEKKEKKTKEKRGPKKNRTPGLSTWKRRRGGSAGRITLGLLKMPRLDWDTRELAYDLLWYWQFPMEFLGCELDFPILSGYHLICNWNNPKIRRYEVTFAIKCRSQTSELSSRLCGSDIALILIDKSDAYYYSTCKV